MIQIIACKISFMVGLYNQLFSILIVLQSVPVQPNFNQQTCSIDLENGKSAAEF